MLTARLYEELGLETNEPLLALLSEAVRKPTYCIPIVRRGVRATLYGTFFDEETHRSRTFARILTARANHRIAIGDIDGAIDDVITCRRLGRHLQDEPSLLASLVGLAVESAAISVGPAGNRDTPPTLDQLQHFNAELDVLPQRQESDALALAYRLSTLEVLQAAAHGDVSPGVMFPFRADREALTRAIAARSALDWNVIMQRVNAAFDDPSIATDTPPAQMCSCGTLFLGERSRRAADVAVEKAVPKKWVLPDAVRRIECLDNLQRISLAMLMYEREHGTLPPGYAVDADGKPLHSWRVLLLPYLGQRELYGKLRLDQPWDSEHNRSFYDAAPAVYQCPGTSLTPSQTTYSVVVGPHTAFGAGAGKPLDAFGMNLALVVERKRPICWMDPASELTDSIAAEGINRGEDGVDGVASPHPTVSIIGLRDGSATTVSEKIEPRTWQSLLDGTAEQPLDWAKRGM